MRGERPGGGAAVHRLQHRRLHFHKVAGRQALTNRLDDLRARLEDLSHIRIDKQIHVAPAIAQVHIRQAVPFARRRQQGLGQKTELGRPHCILAGLGLAELALDGDDIAEVDLLDRRPMIREILLGQPDLQIPATVANLQECQLAHRAVQHDPPTDANARRLGCFTGAQIKRLDLLMNFRR